MMLVYMPNCYLLYGPCVDQYGYRVLAYKCGKIIYNEKASCLTGHFLNTIGLTSNISDNRIQVYVIYVGLDGLIKRNTFEYDKNKHTFVLYEKTQPIIGWRDLSPTTLGIMRHEYEISDWPAYCRLFIETWRTFPTFWHNRMVRTRIKF